MTENDRDVEKTTETVVEKTSASATDAGGPLGNVTEAVLETEPVEAVKETTTVTEKSSD